MDVVIEELFPELNEVDRDWFIYHIRVITQVTFFSFEIHLKICVVHGINIYTTQKISFILLLDNKKKNLASITIHGFSSRFPVCIQKL